MQAEYLDYKDGAETFEAYIAQDSSTSEKRPCVVLCHAWAGQTENERKIADEIAKLGYVAFAADVYGKGRRGDLLGDNSALMQPMLDDRALLLQRLRRSVKTAAALPSVDSNRIAAIGYCFGGLCVLDLARSGDSTPKGVVSFHGIFNPPGLGKQGDIKSKVLILHGYDDPMATPEQMVGVATELTEAKADWQIHAYGHTLHAFTAKGANAPERGVKYDEAADKRSWQAMKNFLEELFA